MNVEIPKDCTEEEKRLIEKALEESIANTLGIDPKDVKVTIDPETGEATYQISADDATSAEEMQKAVRADDFAQNVNKSIDENKSNLPKRIQDALKIKDVTPGDTLDVNNYFF